MDVIVIGAGVIGLTTAIRLAENGHAVTVRTAELPADTTSAVAGAMCSPIFPMGDERLDRWGATGVRVFTELAADESTGVRLTRGRLVSAFGSGADLPPPVRQLPGFALCTEDEAAGFPLAFWAEVPTTDMPVYLDYLTQRLAAAGGTVVVQRVADLSEVSAPVVVNCTGTAARDLVPDSEVRAVKGQHVVVANPGLDTFFFEHSTTGEWAGYFPYGDHVVLGGVAIEDDWDRAPDAEVSSGILARCAKLEPRLAGAEVLHAVAGLRPHRATPRVEAERIGATQYLHNYGHGGTGVTWSWGAADDVVALLN